MDNKELIWVEKEFAEKYKEVESDAGKQNLRIKMFDEYMQKISDRSKEEFKANFESLEEDVAIYNGLMLKVKQTFEKAKNEQLDASYALWEKFDKEMPSVSKKIDNIIEQMNPVIKAVEEINSGLSKINTYKLEGVLDLVSKFNGMTDESKKVVKFLVKNFK